MPNETRNAARISAILVLISLIFALPVVADEAVSFRLGGATIPVSNPQKDIFDPGKSIAAEYFFSLVGRLDLGLNAAYAEYTKIKGQKVKLSKDRGYALAFGSGLRYNQPLGKDFLAWANTDFLYVRTGKLDRPGFSSGAGLLTSLGKNFYFGPFVNYLQIIQDEKVGFDNRDARLLTVGLNFEWRWSGTSKKNWPQKTQTIKPEIRFSDRDHDGVGDEIDNCPDEFGTVKNNGCPEGKYDGLLIGKEKIELKNEKIQFYFDDSEIKPESFPILCEVGEYLRGNPSIYIRIEGHASSEGSVEYNLNLSLRRARVVLNYLVAYSIDSKRLSAYGFGETRPIAKNDTEEGRALNRRVEFVITGGGAK